MLLRRFEALAELPELCQWVDFVRWGYGRSVCGVHSIHYRQNGEIAEIGCRTILSNGWGSSVHMLENQKVFIAELAALYSIHDVICTVRLGQAVESN